MRVVCVHNSVVACASYIDHSQSRIVLPSTAVLLSLYTVAPPGSYVDRGVGHLCPPGSYQPDHNSNNFCLRCPVGLITAQEGSTSLSNCTIALEGYYLSGPSTAEPCPRNTYNDREGVITACTPCPHGGLML